LRPSRRTLRTSSWLVIVSGPSPTSRNPCAARKPQVR
jgi:hypothetical protein